MTSSSMPEDERRFLRDGSPLFIRAVQERNHDGQMTLETAAPLRDNAIAAVECTGDPKPTDRVLHSTHFGDRQSSSAIRDITAQTHGTESNAS